MKRLVLTDELVEVFEIEPITPIISTRDVAVLGVIVTAMFVMSTGVADVVEKEVVENALTTFDPIPPVNP